MRYQGSKARIVNDILPIITKNLYGTDRIFIDLFGGGMNVVSKVDHPYKIAVDVNKYMIDLWRDIKRDGVENVIPEYVTESDYKTAKEQYLSGSHKPYTKGQIGFIATACSYGGGWFNGYAKFNPNKNEDHVKEAINGIKKQVDTFKFLYTTEFLDCHYVDAFAWIRRFGFYGLSKIEPIPSDKVVIYCDAPYCETKGYESDFDHVKYWDWVRMYSKAGYEIYVSEYSAPSDFKCVWEKHISDGMGTTVKGRKQEVKTERLFVYNG
jgi:DNA adenine methylase